MAQFQIKAKDLSLKNAVISCIIIISFCFYVYYGLYSLFVNQENLGFDFKIYYYTAQKYLNGMPLYHDSIGIYPYLYPPVALMVFLPFAKLELPFAVDTWFLICTALLVFSVFITYSWGKKANSYLSAAAAMMAFLFSMPLYSTIFLGNVNIVIFFGLCLIYHFVITKKTTLVPWIMAISTYIKLFPAILIMIFLRRGNFRVIGIFILALLVTGMISVLAFGFEEHLNFLMNMAEGYRWVGPIQMLSFSYVIKLFFPHRYIICMILNIFFGALLFSSWWNLSNKVARRDVSGLIVDLFLLSVMMLLLFPSSSINYPIFLITPFYFVILSRLQNKNQFKYFWLFILLFILINLWEIIANHLPLTSEHFTLVELGSRRNQFPVLYPLYHSLPFIFLTLLYWWFFVNYSRLNQAVVSLLNSATDGDVRR